VSFCWAVSGKLESNKTATELPREMDLAAFLTKLID
jgi:hypothetical protein